MAEPFWQIKANPNATWLQCRECGPLACAAEAAPDVEPERAEFKIPEQSQLG
jgi:hypothetical protein